MRIGIDLGGTKVEGLALADDGAELSRLRVPTPREDYLGTLRTIVDVVAHLEERTGRSGTVGVGMPGTVSPLSGTAKNANSTWLNARPFDRDLAQLLGRPVRCANDANCLALSEASDGAAAGSGVVFGVILGTGTGGGVVVDGRPLAGRNGVAGEWGHMPLPWPAPEELPGPRCWCGRDGCVETWLSGPALARDHERVTGAAANGEQIARLAADGDEAAVATLARYTSRLARSLAVVVDVLDPDVIVLGGGVSNIERLPADVGARLAEWVFGGEAATPIRRAAHGDSSGVRGAAWLWPVDAQG